MQGWPRLPSPKCLSRSYEQLDSANTNRAYPIGNNIVDELGRPIPYALGKAKHQGGNQGLELGALQHSKQTPYTNGSQPPSSEETAAQARLFASLQSHKSLDLAADNADVDQMPMPSGVDAPLSSVPAEHAGQDS